MFISTTCARGLFRGCFSPKEATKRTLTMRLLNEVLLKKSLTLFLFFLNCFFFGTATWICFSISVMLWEMLEIFNIRLNRMSLVQAIGNLASCQAIGSGALMGPSSKLISWLYFGWFLSVLRWFEIQSDGNAHCVRDFIIFFKPLLFNSLCWLK